MQTTNETKITPFDTECMLMAERVLGKSGHCECKDNGYIFRVDADGADQKLRKATEQALRGRLGERLQSLVWNETEDNTQMVVSVDYKQGSENDNRESNTEFAQEQDTSVGNVYCAKLREIKALSVTDENAEKLITFTGGGRIERNSAGQIVCYYYIDENGIMQHARHHDYIVHFNGLTYTMSESEFLCYYETK